MPIARVRGVSGCGGAGCGAGRRPPQAQVPRVASAAADRRVRPHLPAAGSAACTEAQARPRRRRCALAPARDAGPRAVRAAGVRGSERSLCKLLRLLCAMCACAIYYVYCSLVVAHGGAGRARVGWLGGRPRPRAGSRARLSSRARELTVHSLKQIDPLKPIDDVNAILLSEGGYGRRTSGGLAVRCA